MRFAIIKKCLNNYPIAFVRRRFQMIFNLRQTYRAFNHTLIHRSVPNIKNGDKRNADPHFQNNTSEKASW